MQSAGALERIFKWRFHDIRKGTNFLMQSARALERILRLTFNKDIGLQF